MFSLCCLSVEEHIAWLTFPLSWYAGGAVMLVVALSTEKPSSVTVRRIAR